MEEENSGELAEAIINAFGPLIHLRTHFLMQPLHDLNRWAWLCVHEGGKVEVCSSANQDNPLMPGIGCGGTPFQIRRVGACILFKLPK